MAHSVAPQAENDLDNIWQYLAQESGSLDIADAVIDTITRRFLLLSGNP
jgi:plasmid stabilization system protein ParE